MPLKSIDSSNHLLQPSRLPPRLLRPCPRMSLSTPYRMQVLLIRYKSGDSIKHSFQPGRLTDEV